MLLQYENLKALQLERKAALEHASDAFLPDPLQVRRGGGWDPTIAGVRVEGWRIGYLEQLQRSERPCAGRPGTTHTRLFPYPICARL